MAQNISIFQSLDDLRIITFWIILRDNNPFLLDANYSPDKKYSEKEQLFILDVWQKLYDTFFMIRDDAKGRAILKEKDSEMKLLEKVNLLIDLRNHLVKLFESCQAFNSMGPKGINTYEDLKFSAYKLVSKTEKRIVISPFMPALEVIQKIDKFVSSLQNTFVLKKKRNTQDIDNQIKNIYKSVSDVESVLERSLPNIDTMPVMQWLAYETSAKEKNNQLRNSGRNGKR